MNTFIKILLIIFLLLGIIFFTVCIGLFYKNEMMSSSSVKDDRHSLRINDIKLTKNGYFDTTFKQRVAAEDEAMHGQLSSSDNCVFSVIDLADSITYAQSGSFSLKTATPPQTISFYNETIVPQMTLKDKYEIVITRNNQRLVTFPVESFYKLLDLRNKKDNNTEHRELKLTSTDQKVTIFLMLSIDQLS